MSDKEKNKNDITILDNTDNLKVRDCISHTDKTEIKDNINKSKVTEKKNNSTDFNKNFKTCLLIIFSFVIGGVITISLLKWTPLLNNLINSNSIDTTKNTKVYEKSSLATSINKVYKAVVMVKSFKGDEEYSTGTGFVYKTDDKYGYVMTNEHVVSGCDKIVLVLANDEEVEAKVISGDSYLDIAVMTIDKSKVLQTASIGTSESMNIGDTIFTVGSPMGYEYRGTVTSGILSGKDRMVSVSVSNSNSSDWVMKVLQIDAAINPGNSGGPLVNINGEVIGVTSMKLVEDEIEGMGFAIPIEIAMAHIDELEKGNKIEWPMLGISMANVTDSSLLFRNNITVDKNIKSGVVVVEISNGSGASKSDLKSGDVITKINDEEVEDSAYLRYELYKNKPGDTITVTYIRDGKEKSTKVTLTKSTTD